MKRLNKSVRYIIPICAVIAAVILFFARYYKPVNIYMFHSVSNLIIGKDADMCVRPDEFDTFVRLVCKKGTTGFIGEKADYYITFDDGYADNFTSAFPILKKYSAKATIFVIPSLIGSSGYMDEEMIKELSESGLVSIQCHTYSHISLGDENITAEELERELVRSKEYLQNLTGQQVNILAYPEGQYTEAIIDYISKNSLYDIAVTTKTPSLFGCFNSLTLPRTGVKRGLSEKQMKQMLSKINFYELFN